MPEFGPVEGSPVGTVFANREELRQSGIHPPSIAGISGTAKHGATSIVLNGGYADDEDYGAVIIYTGFGGRDSRGRQIEDQRLSAQNLALKVSCDQELPVRVTRGPKGEPQLSPSQGYRYDGLYNVVRYWPDTGVHGYRIWRYRLERVDQSELVAPNTTQPAARQTAITDRIVRNSALSERIKRVHDFSCQVCGERLESPGGPYAEAAHIKPLGRPDDGPDIEQNLLCLCPNHHKLLDKGGILIEPDLVVKYQGQDQAIGPLKLSARHVVGPEFLEWHRQRWLHA